MIDATPEIIREIARETGLAVPDIAQAVQYQWKYVTMIMKSDTYQTVHLDYLGKFKVDPRQLRRVRELQLSGKIKPTKSGRNKVVDRPDDFKDIEEWENKKRK